MVLFALDAEKGEGRELARRYAAVSFPTFQMVDADGATISRWIGYDKDEVVRYVDAAIEDATPIEARRARFEREPQSADALALGRYHRALMDYARAATFLRQAAALSTDPSVDHHYEIFETLVLGFRSRSVPLQAVREAANDVVGRDDRDPVEVVRVAAVMTGIGRQRNDHDIMRPYLEAAVEVTAGAEDEWLQLARREILIEHALFVLKKPERAVALRRSMYPKGWQDDAEQLNAFAWWCFENRINLDEAAVMAQKGVEISADRRTKANVLDTLAEIRNAQGDPHDAVRYIEAALEEAPHWSHLPKQLARFRKAAAEQDRDG